MPPPKHGSWSSIGKLALVQCGFSRLSAHCRQTSPLGVKGPNLEGTSSVHEIEARIVH